MRTVLRGVPGPGPSHGCLRDLERGRTVARAGSPSFLLSPFRFRFLRGMLAASPPALPFFSSDGKFGLTGRPAPSQHSYSAVRVLWVSVVAGVRSVLSPSLSVSSRVTSLRVLRAGQRPSVPQMHVTPNQLTTSLSCLSETYACRLSVYFFLNFYFIPGSRAHNCLGEDWCKGRVSGGVSRAKERRGLCRKGHHAPLLGRGRPLSTPDGQFLLLPVSHTGPRRLYLGPAVWVGRSLEPEKCALGLLGGLEAGESKS